MGDPYYITGPALISFSGGRTSAYMLHEILRAHDGTLPDDVVVAFTNTAKEREETLRFVHECGSRWNVRVRWLEWRPRASDPYPFTADELREGGLAQWWLDAASRCGDAGFEEVGYNSASRSGEPFEGLIRKKGFVPNGVTRFCSRELKVRVMRDFCRSLGWTHWKSVVGLRYDEGHRVMKALDANDSGKERWTAVMPLSSAKVTVRDVAAFWREQPFDLQLESYEGNCDLCFLKSRGKLKRLIRDHPHMASWWMAQEEQAAETATGDGANFRQGESYWSLVGEVVNQPFMPGLLVDDEEHDAECGLHCGAEAAA